MIESKLISKALFTDKTFTSLDNLIVEIGINSYASMKQTHSDKVVQINKAGNYDSDGILTSTKNLGLVVKTADCLPILLEDDISIGAVHAGWRGVKNNIVKKALKHFKSSH